MLLGYVHIAIVRDNHDGLATRMLATACERVFLETKAAGAQARKGLTLALATATAGDVLVVPALKHLATTELRILATIRAALKRGTDFRTLDGSFSTESAEVRAALLTITASHGRGRRHRPRGAPTGRKRGHPVKTTPAILKEARALVSERGTSVTKAAMELSVSRASLNRHLKAQQALSEGR